MNKVTENVLLDVRDLRTSFFTQSGEVKAVGGVSFHVNKQEVVAIVGESGCGKSVTQMSVMQLIQSPPGKILGGEVIFDGRNLLQYRPNSKEMRAVRGAEIAMIFQEPMTSLNPVYTVGSQLSEVIRTHLKVDKKLAWEMGVKALESVGIPDPQQRMKNYPFEMSGGMRQRVMIAIAVACKSKLIIADEPTTALDVTTQAQVMELLISLVQKMRTSLIVVTHNLGLVTRYADRSIHIRLDCWSPFPNWTRKRERIWFRFMVLHRIWQNCPIHAHFCLDVHMHVKPARNRMRRPSAG